MLNVYEFYLKSKKMLENGPRREGQSPSIRQMTVLALISSRTAETTKEIAEAMQLSEPSVKSILRSLEDGGTGSPIHGYKFIYREKMHVEYYGKPVNRYKLTKEGKQYAKLIMDTFGD